MSKKRTRISHTLCVCMCVCQSLSCVQLFMTPWTIAYQAPLSMEFSRQEYWGELPFPSPGNFPNPGIKPGSPTLQADSLLSEPPGKPGKGDRGRKVVANQGFSTCCNCSNHYFGSKVEVPNLQAMDRYWSVVCQELGHTAGGEWQVRENASSVFTAAPHCSHHHLSSTSCQISGGILRSTDPNTKVKVEYPDIATKQK